MLLCLAQELWTKREKPVALDLDAVMADGGNGTAAEANGTAAAHSNGAAGELGVSACKALGLTDQHRVWSVRGERPGHRPGSAGHLDDSCLGRKCPTCVAPCNEPQQLDGEAVACSGRAQHQSLQGRRPSVGCDRVASEDLHCWETPTASGVLRYLRYRVDRLCKEF